MPTDSDFCFLGVVHLPPLPAAPIGARDRGAVLSSALRDADALVAGGADGMVIENLGDAPFARGRVDPHVAALLAVVGDRLRQRFGDRVLLGVNVLRNDARSALGAACACAADFVRVNVWSGATWTDQGLIQGEAHAALRYRSELRLDPTTGEAGVRVAADVMVKHGVPAGDRDLARVARDTAGRGGADVLIVTGAATGRPTDLDDVAVVMGAADGTPVWVGSGVTEVTAPLVRAACAGAIVGTALHHDARIDRPLNPRRVERMRAAFERKDAASL